jgi:hypothetical protein
MYRSRVLDTEPHEKGAALSYRHGCCLQRKDTLLMIMLP